MVKKQQKKDCYTREMELFISQVENSIALSNLTVRKNEAVVAALKKGLSIERQQLRLRNRNLSRAKKQLALYLKRKKING